MKHTQKPKVAIISLTSCEGCQFVMLDQGHRFLDWLGSVDVEDFRLIKEGPHFSNSYDICFVEGNPVTKENISLLREMRKRSKLLVVVGNCAALGGVWEIKNYHSKEKAIKSVYKTMKVANPDIKEVDNFVTVDFVIPGCPINGDEFMECAHQLLRGRIPVLPQNPVCRECRLRGYECLLQKGELCLGPIVLGGCKAVCLKAGQPCWGCRGLCEGAQIENLMNFLAKKFSQEEINRVTEVFGLRDSLPSASPAKKIKNKNKK